MLTGQRLFEDETTSDILAAVLMKDPDWNRAPIEARTLLRRCLAKDPTQRLQDIGDAMPLLHPAWRPEQSTPSRSARIPWAIAAVVVAALGLAFWLLWPARPIPSAPVQFQMSLPGGASAPIFAVSPDGRRIVLNEVGSDGRGRLAVRSLDSLEIHELPGTEMPGNVPFWSFDSRFVVFTSPDRRLKKIDVNGGLPQVVCDLNGDILGGSWNAEGTILFAVLTSGRVMSVPAAGGEPVTILDAGKEQFGGVFPAFLPDGRHFTFAKTFTEVAMGSLDAQRSKETPQVLVANTASTSTANMMFVPSGTPNLGRILFVRGTTLMAQPFDVRQLKFTGEAVPVVEHVSFFSASANTLVFSSTNDESYQLTWVDLKGNTTTTLGEPGPYSQARISPDSTRAAIVKRSEGSRFDVWLMDLLRGTIERLTSRDGMTGTPAIWSPEGDSIIYGAAGPGLAADLYRKAVNSNKAEEAIFHGNTFPTATSWSKDGRFLLTQVFDSKTGNDIIAVSMDATTPASRKQTPLLTGSFNERDAVFSPDQRWIAYMSDETNRQEIYVYGFSPGSDTEAPHVTKRFLISTSGGSDPLWSSDSKQLMYVSPARDLMAVDVTNDPDRPFSSPKLIRKSLPNGSIGGLTADGQRLLLAAQVGTKQSPALTVIVNWQSGMSK